MKPVFSTIAQKAAIAAAFLVLNTGVEAQPNPVLPFWAQPFPTGFTREEPGLYPARDRCLVRRRIHTRRGFRSIEEDRCRAVLHARD